jgi:hypothetical protein
MADTAFGAYTAYWPMGTVARYRGKAAGGEVNLPPPPSDEVNEWVELYFCYCYVFMKCAEHNE